MKSKWHVHVFILETGAIPIEMFKWDFGTCALRAYIWHNDDSSKRKRFVIGWPIAVGDVNTNACSAGLRAVWGFILFWLK